MEYQFEAIGPALRLVVLAFMIVAAIAGLGLIVMLAALPGQIAKSRRHPQTDAINICGWLGLPTGILWVIAIVWAYFRNPSTSQTASPQAASLKDIAEQLTGLEKAVVALESANKGAKR